MSYDKRNLPSADVNYNVTEYEYEEPKEEREEEQASPLTEEYYELPLSLNARKRFWSIASFTLGLISILLCFFYYVSIPIAVCAVIAALLSRKNFGFFDQITIVGIILSLVGVVFGVGVFVLDVVGVLALVRK